MLNGILTAIPEDTQVFPHSLHLDASNTAIILEGAITIDDLDLPNARCLTFRLIYALNLEYPSQLRNTFDFIQKVVSQ